MMQAGAGGEVGWRRCEKAENIGKVIKYIDKMLIGFMYFLFIFILMSGANFPYILKTTDVAVIPMSFIYIPINNHCVNDE